MSLTGKLQGEDKHEAREAKYAKRVALYSRSRRVYEVEWCSELHARKGILAVERMEKECPINVTMEKLEESTMSPSMLLALL